MEKKLLLLGVLRQQEMHGYQLYEFIDRALTACTDLKKSTAYYMLNQMAKAGWVTEERGQAGNRPLRTVYRLTPRGEAEFQRLLRENLARDEPVYFPGDIGLTFLDVLPAEEALTLVKKRRGAVAARLAEGHSVPAHPGSFQLAIEHRARHLAAELDWLDEVIRRLASSSLQGRVDHA